MSLRRAHAATLTRRAHSRGRQAVAGHRYAARLIRRLRLARGLGVVRRSTVGCTSRPRSPHTPLGTVLAPGRGSVLAWPWGARAACACAAEALWRSRRAKQARMPRSLPAWLERGVLGERGRRAWRRTSPHTGPHAAQALHPGTARRAASCASGPASPVQPGRLVGAAASVHARRAARAGLGGAVGPEVWRGPGALPGAPGRRARRFLRHRAPRGARARARRRRRLRLRRTRRRQRSMRRRRRGLCGWRWGGGGAAGKRECVWGARAPEPGLPHAGLERPGGRQPALHPGQRSALPAWLRRQHAGLGGAGRMHRCASWGGRSPAVLRGRAPGGRELVSARRNPGCVVGTVEPWQAALL
jgi:hypothetical protein